MQCDESKGGVGGRGCKGEWCQNASCPKVLSYTFELKYKIDDHELEDHVGEKALELAIKVWAHQKNSSAKFF